MSVRTPTLLAWNALLGLLGNVAVVPSSNEAGRDAGEPIAREMARLLALVAHVWLAGRAFHRGTPAS